MVQRAWLCLLTLIAVSASQSLVYAETTITVTSGTPNNTVHFKHVGMSGDALEVQYQELSIPGYVPVGNIIAETMDQVGNYQYHEKYATGGLPKNKLYRVRIMKTVNGVQTQVFPNSGWGMFGTGP
jgi:hypothetical protein